MTRAPRKAPRVAAMMIGLGIAAAACSSGSATGGSPGAEGAPCYPNGTCNAGLSCYSSLCVRGGSPGKDGGSIGAASDGGGPTTGKIGGPCGTGGTCDSGLTCIAQSFGTAADGGPSPNTEHFCSPSCATGNDCNAFLQTSYLIQIPDTFTPEFRSATADNWQSKSDVGGTTFLSRGAACAPANGASSGPKYCQFFCPNFAAVNQDSLSCYCLPGYSLSADKTACQFGTSHQCSAFTYATDAMLATLSRYGIQAQHPTCDACNADQSELNYQLGCHSGVFFCDIRTTALNGDCAELLTTSALNQCIAQKANFNCNCDNTCSSACDLGDVSCINNCCTCTPSATAPTPMCTHPADAGGGG